MREPLFTVFVRCFPKREAWSSSGSIMTAVESNRVTTTPQPEAFRCLVPSKVPASVVVWRDSVVSGEDAELCQQLISQFVESVPADPSGTRQLDVPVDGDLRVSEHEDPVGQQNGLLDVVGHQ
jgi:hypothetical protein